MVARPRPQAAEGVASRARSGRIQSVDRSAEILRVLAGGSPTIGVTDIAERMRLPKPTVHGLLRTLEHNGLVSQDPDSGKYCLGPFVLQLANAYLAGSELRARSMLRAAALAREVNEVVWVGVLTGADVMVVHHEFRPDDVVQIPEIGATIPWHACALGHAIAAHLPEEELHALLGAALRPLTGRTHTTMRGLVPVLDKVRKAGYAVENQEANVGDAGIAAPIFERSGAVGGAIGVVGPVERLLDRATLPALARSVVDTARAISRDMSGRRVAMLDGG